MEANAPQQDTSDGSDTEEYNSSSEDVLNSSDSLLNCPARDSPHTSSGDFTSSQYTSSELPSSVMGSECSSYRNSTPDSSLAQPLSSSEESTLKSSSELSCNSVVNFERVGNGSKEAGSEVSQPSNGTAKAAVFKATKFDILKAMKAEVLKATETEIPQAGEDKNADRMRAVGNEKTIETSEETLTKDYKEPEVKVNKERIAKDYKEPEVKVNERIAKDCVERKDKGNEGIDTTVRREMEIDDSENTGDVTNITEPTVSRAAKLEAEVSTSSLIAPLTVKTEVNEVEAKSETATIVEPMEFKLSEIVECEVNKITHSMPEVTTEVNVIPKEEVGEAMETEELEEPLENSVIKGETSTVPEASTSEPVDAGTSNISLEEEEDIDLGCNDDSRGSSDILGEEAKRLDQLGLSSQMTPEPEVQGGEEERDKQYKKLVDLLSKSKFYTDVLLKKLESDVVKYSRKRKHPDAAKNGDSQEDKSASPSKQCSPSKKKKILMENQRAMYQVATEVIKNKRTQRNKVVDANATESQSTAEEKPVEKIQQPKLLSGGTLRDYQLEGFNWLKALYENGVNGILADEMGLGKTIQVIALLSHLVEMKIKGPFLIVGPLSTLPNWMVEFKRFAPQLYVTLFYGSQIERKKMCETLMKRKTVNGVLCFPIVITSYEIPCFERTFMGKIKWKYIIVDEGHRIKNYNTVLAKVLRSFDSANRLLLTGTPLHNSLSELWSLLNFLVPEIFDNLEVFESWFRIEELKDVAGRMKIIEEERRKNVLSTLHQILAPFMLRRIKADVTLDIPKKKEVCVQAPMTDTQLKLYQAVLERNFDVLRRLPADGLVVPDVDGKRPRRSCTLGKNYEEKSEHDDFDILDSDIYNDSEKKNVNIDAVITHYIRVKMQNPLMALKLIANHPFLIHYPLQEDGKSYLIDEAVVRQSGKFLVLDALLEKLHSKGHKVLIFSTLCMLLDIVEDYLSLRTYSYERLDGNVKITDRADAIQRFNNDENIFLFLLSTRAGGLGVNLTGADTVIFLDSDWNPQVDLQAQDRCHRIGQTKPVMIYRLVTTGTIDEEIMKRAGAKRVLEKMVICKGASFQKDFDLEELKTILESKDHSEIVYTDGQVLTDEQLEKLLDRSDLLN